ncbi:CRISPR-associated endonuclease Cas2 [Mesoaciditoga lauensis]|uniref:CRISPR-associated endonuclease Cas2 n=1 Tax=Mesoaciditoga lauensis TaxID=1495039 RepID=UPI000565D4B3|nr:CRISPR-associated endonuclease Cas2 [Mesoaciditoga lauensis]
MYVIMAYDINEKRVNKVLKKSREYLTWVQNSLLEGEITEAKFKILKSKIENIINSEEDSVTWYIFDSKRILKKESIGVEKGTPDILL